MVVLISLVFCVLHIVTGGVPLLRMSVTEYIIVGGQTNIPSKFLLQYVLDDK